MSNNSISTYKFKPFQFTVVKKNLDAQQCPTLRLGYGVMCSNNAYLFSFGCFNAQRDDVLDQIESSTMHGRLWKFYFELGEWKMIKYQKLNQNLTVILSGNIMILYGGPGVPSGEFCSNRMFLGNLANLYKENGMSFVDLEESGDVPLSLYGLGNVMDGKYIYSIGGTSGDGQEMDVHRFNLSTRRWELLHKSKGEAKVPEPRYQHRVFFYKGRIYIIGCSRGRAREIIHGYSEILMFDVATKQWQLLPAKHDNRVPVPGYPKNRSFHSCVQCPGKSNLVFICGGLDDSKSLNDVWRIDFDTLQWEKLTTCIMLRPAYFHSTAITPSGRMYCFGGIVPENDIVNRNGSNPNDITSAWIMIPKLKDICWEAMGYYFKEQMFKSSDEDLKKIGLPQEYYERIIDARRIS